MDNEVPERLIENARRHAGFASAKFDDTQTGWVIKLYAHGPISNTQIAAKVRVFLDDLNESLGFTARERGTATTTTKPPGYVNKPKPHLHSVK